MLGPGERWCAAGWQSVKHLLVMANRRPLETRKRCKASQSSSKRCLSRWVLALLTPADLNGRCSSKSPSQAKVWSSQRKIQLWSREEKSSQVMDWDMGSIKILPGGCPNPSVGGSRCPRKKSPWEKSVRQRQQVSSLFEFWHLFAFLTHIKLVHHQVFCCL